MAAKRGLVKAHDFVVCVQRIHSEFCVKVRPKCGQVWRV